MHSRRTITIRSQFDAKREQDPPRILTSSRGAVGERPQASAIGAAWESRGARRRCARRTAVAIACAMGSNGPTRQRSASAGPGSGGRSVVFWPHVASRTCLTPRKARAARQNGKLGGTLLQTNTQVLLTLFTYSIYLKYATEENECYGLGVFPLRA